MQNKKIMKAVLIAGLCFTGLFLPVTASNLVENNINTKTTNEDEINFLLTEEFYKHHNSILLQFEDIHMDIKNNIENTDVDKTVTSDLVENNEDKKAEKNKKPKVENTTKVEKIKQSDSEKVSLGTFKLTAYCNCSKCCGKWAGSPTASGVMPRSNHTIAVDTNIIPFGAKVIIDGNTYVAEDTGSSIINNRIDVYFDNHQEALNFGVQYKEVFVYN